MDTTVEHEEGSMNYTETISYTSPDVEMGDVDASQDYLDENSPEVANVEPVVAIGAKRKPLQQQVVEGQTRKKLKSPSPPKNVQSIFDSDSDHVSVPPATSTPAVPAKPKAVKAKKVTVTAKNLQQNEEPENTEHIPEPVAKPAAKKGRPAKGEEPEENEHVSEPVAKPAAKKGRPPKGEQPEENEHVPEPVAKPAAKNGRPPKGEAAVKAPTAASAKPKGDAAVKAPTAKSAKPKADAAVKAPAATSAKPKSKGEEKPAATTSVESKAQTRPKKASAEPKGSEVKPVKIKIGVPKTTKHKHPTINVMLEEAMEVINNTRKGVSYKEVKHYISTTFMYENDPLLKKNVKAHINSGEYVKVTGNGLNGKFKLKPKHKRRTKSMESEATPSPSSAGKKSRNGSKPVNSMTEVKPNKRRKSVSVQAPKVPKPKKMVAEKDVKGKKVTKTKSDPVAKAAKKTPTDAIKKTSARVKATRSNS